MVNAAIVVLVNSIARNSVRLASKLAAPVSFAARSVELPARPHSHPDIATNPKMAKFLVPIAHELIAHFYHSVNNSNSDLRWYSVDDDRYLVCIRIAMRMPVPAS